jgi:tryptophan synthase alpha chain
MMLGELIVYLTAGHPNKEEFLKFADEISGTVDAIEIGIKPRIAKYDGPVIRRSYLAATRCTRKDLIAMVSGLSSYLVALTYLDDLIDDELRLMKSSGYSAVLIPDLIIDYPERLADTAQLVNRNGLKNALFVTPFTPDSYIDAASRLADAFLYLGIRPSTGVPTPVDVGKIVKRIRERHRGKLVVGFGLSESEIKVALSSGADGIAVGSSIVSALEKDREKALELVKRLREVVDSV